MTEEESQAIYDRYHIPAGRIIWDGALANFQPHSEAKVDFKNPTRAPLLFIAGSEDRVNPASVNKANYKLPVEVTFGYGLHRVCGPLSLHMRPGRLASPRRLRPLLGKPTASGEVAAEFGGTDPKDPARSLRRQAEASHSHQEQLRAF